MKALFLLLLLFVCGAQFCAADVIELSVDGTLLPPEGPPGFWDSSLSSSGGTPFSFNLTYDSGSAALTFSTSQAATYPGTNGGVGFGDYTMQVAGGDITVDDSPSANGVVVILPGILNNTSAELRLNLYPLDPLATTDLSNFYDLAQLPLRDFSYGTSGNLSAVTDFQVQFLNAPDYDEDLTGHITSISAQDLSAPEPSTWALLVLGLGALALFVRHTRKKGRTTS